MQTPVLFLIFSRPETTERVFSQIRKARPEQLYVAADGPRKGRTEEEVKCSRTRSIIENGVDWPCEVKTLYRNENLGCREAVSQAIGWFFDNVEEGIILEDDTLPHLDFFGFCESMLREYRNDPRIMHVGGFNVASNYTPDVWHHWFSYHAWIWGWATWKRAWKEYDFTMTTWNQRLPTLRKTFASDWEQAFWEASWRECREDPVKANTWDFPWMYTTRSLQGISILPSKSLIENIGFGLDATHTFNGNDYSARVRASPISSKSKKVLGKVIPFRDEMFTRCYSGEPINALNNLRSAVRTFLHST